jgi:hypothetical protein
MLQFLPRSHAKFIQCAAANVREKNTFATRKRTKLHSFRQSDHTGCYIAFRFVFIDEKLEFL